MSEQINLFTEPSPEFKKKSKPEPKPERIPEPVNTEKRVVYFDLETQKSADNEGGWGNIQLMKISVGVIWDSLEEKYISDWEKGTKLLVEKLKSADLVVGFNVIGFDYSV
jgi:DEAD/DEAH box helicase domain-containing protein